MFAGGLLAADVATWLVLPKSMMIVVCSSAVTIATNRVERADVPSGELLVDLRRLKRCSDLGTLKMSRARHASAVARPNPRLSETRRWAGIVAFGAYANSLVGHTRWV